FGKWVLCPRPAFALASRKTLADIRRMRIYTLVILATGMAMTRGLQAEINPKNFDPAVKPQDDFFHNANGGWIKAATIPPDKTSWGAFDELDERNKANVHTILERAAATKS